MYDIAVVGGGPAGLAAAIHTRARGKAALVLSSEPLSSPLCRAGRIDNYPGLPQVSGKALVEKLLAQAEELGSELRLGRVLNIMPQKAGFMLGVGPDIVEARAVILATGIQRSAKLPGEAELLGRGVSYCATCDGMFYRGRTVAVAGDAAGLEEEAAFLEKIGCHVTRTPLAGLKILGEGRVEAVESGGKRIPCDGVFLLRRSVALSDLLPALETKNGYIKVDRALRTNLPRVYAAGDCTGQPLQLAKAVGEGQMAAHTACQELDEGA